MHIASAVASGFAPVLVLRAGDQHHAVTAVGYSLRPPPDPGKETARLLEHPPYRLKGLYVHDDRLGPYEIADVGPRPGSDRLTLRYAEEPDRVWELTHILVPLHEKIRISFPSMWQLLVHYEEEVGLAVGRARTNEGRADANANPVIAGLRVYKATRYWRDLLFGAVPMPGDFVDEFARTVPLSRYVGVVHLSGADFGPVELLIDTTSTLNNLHTLAVVARQCDQTTSEVADWLGETFGCNVYRK